MAHSDTLQQSQYNPQFWGAFNPQFGQMGGGFGSAPIAGIGNGLGYNGLGQAAFGQQWGQFGAQPFGQSYAAAPNMGYGASSYGSPWGFQQRQLSQHEVGDVVRQLVPLLPHLIAQAQTQPQAAFGHGGMANNNPWGQQGRMLTPQDVNEVVRQILPILPQIVGALQGQVPNFAPLNYAQGQQGQGAQWGIGQAFAGQQNPFGQSHPWQHNFGQQPFAQQVPLAAFGGMPQHQLSQQDVGEIARQLAGIIPQVIGTLQAGQQRVM